MRRPTLDGLVNVVIAITCVAVLSTLAKRYLESNGSQDTAFFTVGNPGPELEGIKYSEHRNTLVMYLRSTCQYCTDSMPFYRTLRKEAVAVTGERARVVVASIDPVEVSKQYLTTHGVEVDSVVVTAPRGIPTPTLVLVDQAGKVRDLWVGLQPPERETIILKTLKDSSTQARASEAERR